MKRISKNKKLMLIYLVVGMLLGGCITKAFYRMGPLFCVLFGMFLGVLLDCFVLQKN